MPAYNLIFDSSDAQPLPSGRRTKLVSRRIGGGGGRSGGSSSGSSSGSTSSGRTGSSSAQSAGSFAGGTLFGGTRYPTSAVGNGIARFTIPASAGTFGGRSAGGGTRGQIYGSSRYGSGYPAGYGTSRGGFYGGGVGGLGFPFMYYPVFFGAGYAGYYGSSRYQNDSERPGGAMTQYALTVPGGVDQSRNNYALYGDYDSVDSAFYSVIDACGVGTDLAANFSVNPNQTVQLYRASTFGLLLDHFDNEQPGDAADADSIEAPIPSLPTDADDTYFACLNSTIAQSLLLPSNEATSAAIPFAQLQFRLVLLPFIVLTILFDLCIG